MVTIDLTYLESIATGDQVFVKEMLELFIKSTLPEIEAIENLSVNSEWDRISLIAHRIKAPVQILGQTETYDMILKLEEFAKNKTSNDQIDELILNIKKNMLEINSELERLINLM